MLETHTTKDGETMLIAQMSDDHLKRTIACFLREAYKARQAVALHKQMEQDPYTQRLYGLSMIDEEAAAVKVRNTIKVLYPYLAEAFFRWGRADLAGDLIDALTYVLDRPGQLTTVPDEEIPIPLLAEPAGKSV